MLNVYFEDPSSSTGYSYRTVANVEFSEIPPSVLVKLTDVNTGKSVWVLGSRIIKIEPKGEENKPAMVVR